MVSCSYIVHSQLQTSLFRQESYHLKWTSNIFYKHFKNCIWIFLNIYILLKRPKVRKRVSPGTFWPELPGIPESQLKPYKYNTEPTDLYWQEDSGLSYNSWRSLNSHQRWSSWSWHISTEQLMGRRQFMT